MLRIALRRLATAVPVLLAILLLDFALLHLGGADWLPRDVSPGADIADLEVHVQALREHYGLDDPLHVRFPRWLARVATLDFGESTQEPRAVIEMIGAALPHTIVLQAAALLAMFALGIPLGTVMAARAGTAPGAALDVTLQGLWSIPSFWLATLLIVYLGTDAGWPLFPIEKGFFLPWVVLTVPGLAVVARQTRSAVVSILASPYVRAARAAGLAERTVLWKYALRGGLVPAATLFGAMLPMLIGGSVVVEWIFNIHGVGRLVWNSVQARDLPVLQALVLFSATLTLIGYVVSDVLAALLDPRIRLR